VGGVPPGKGTRMLREADLVETLPQSYLVERPLQKSCLAMTLGQVSPKKKKKTLSEFSDRGIQEGKSPTFDGEIKKGEEVEAWLLGLRKYF
jgi:hypothetical protein